ncbi:gamma-interferon-inducible lysosomal thiol reductase-like [Haemaphysalis longicornis]
MARSTCPIVLPSLLWLAALTAVGGAARVFQMGRRYDFSKIPKTARIQLYYESLCPYSIAFITEQLWPTFVRVGYLMDVQLVPFGNAFKEQPQTQQEQPDQAAADSADNMAGDGSANLVERFELGHRREEQPGYHYSCQHGPEECFGNVVQSCAAHIFNDTILSLAFITCMSLAQRPQEAGEECARGIARNWDAIQRCAHGGKGLRLQDQMSERTWNLDPPHHYVPWIVVNGEHTDDIQAMAQTDLLQVVCDATPDGRKPPPCFEDMERRRALQKLSASVEERLGDGAAQPGAAAGRSLKDVWL